MKSFPFRPAAVLMGICLFPLIASLIIGIFLPGQAARQEIISAQFEAGKEAGLPDRLIGRAPPSMELAAYLNGRLLDVTQTNAKGDYEFVLPVLPPRRSELVVLPTALDSSTLALMYDPYGFDRLNQPPADLFLEAPFLAATIPEPGGLLLYGSALPFTQLEIFAETCSPSKAHTTVTPLSEDRFLDDEGGFTAFLPLAEGDSLPAQYCIRLSPLEGEENAFEPREYLVAAPAEGPAGGEGVWNRSIEAEFRPEAVRLVFSVEMPDRTLVYKNLADGGMSELQFIAYVFGEVELNVFLDPRKLAWRQEKEADSDRVRVIVESQPLEYLIPEDTATTLYLDTNPVNDTSAPPYANGDTFTAVLEGARVIEASPPATSGNASTQTWRGTLAESHLFKLKVSRAPLPPADPIGRKNLLKTLTEKITNLQIVPSVFLADTLEGQIVDALPYRVPAEAQAQVYDLFSAAYRDDPFVGAGGSKQTFQSLLQSLPGRVPGWLAGLLFGSIWLIPAMLALWALRAERPPVPTLRADLARLAAGALALTALGLDWFEALSRLDLRWDAYLAWQAAGHLVFLLLFLPLPRWTSWLAARPGRVAIVALLSAPLAALAGWFLLTSLPDGWASALLTGLPLLGVAFLLWHAVNVGKAEWKPPPAGISIAALALIFGLSLPVQSLPLSAQLDGMMGISAQGMALARPLLSLSLLVGAVVALRNGFNERLGAPLRPLARGLGRVLLAGFAVGLTPAWGFVPLSLIGGLVLFEWLLPRKPIIPPEVAGTFVKEHHEQGVRDMLKLNRLLRLWRASEASAQKLARENKLDEEEHQRKRDEHEREKRELEQIENLPTDPLTLRDLAFNFGAGRKHWDNLKNSLAWGLILAAPLVVLQGWPLVSESFAKAGAFPFLSTGARLAALTGQYLAAAAFLGYFFPHLRGRNGLEKGGWLAASIILALIPYHLIHAGTLTEWLVITIWAASILAYNLLISLLAFDVRTLLHFKFGAARLPDLYDFGELAAYLTGSGAPLVTTIFTALTNQMNEWVPALLKVVFPSFTLSSAQFELLQILIDIANRIAASL